MLGCVTFYIIEVIMWYHIKAWLLSIMKLLWLLLQIVFHNYVLYLHKYYTQYILSNKAVLMASNIVAILAMQQSNTVRSGDNVEEHPQAVAG